MPDIAIVGTGISGIQLALHLQQAGAATTVYAERSLAEVAAGPPMNMVVRFDRSRQRERDLGVDHWTSADSDVLGINFSAETEPPLGFFGRFDRPGSAVDFRIYLPRLVEDYVERGGELKIMDIDVPTIEGLAQRHDLVVVATGRNGLTRLFPRDDRRSQFSEPQRGLTAGFYHGITPTDPSWVHFQLIPGVGEIFATRVLTFGGPIHGMVIEGVPGSPLEKLSRLDHTRDLTAFNRTVLDLVTQYAPRLRERVNEREFGLARPIDVSQGAITPTVRRAWTRLGNGRLAMTVGDAWIVNDPVAGQGANLASRSAALLAEQILADEVYDERFCQQAETRMWAAAEPVVNWSNALLGPPPDPMVEVLGRAGTDRRIADGFVENFNRPDEMWAMVGTPESTKSWLAAFD